MRTLAAASIAALAADSGPVQLTAQDDQKRMLAVLGIESLRRGADGRNRDAPNAANYDESRANPYPDLPDPLVMKNGRRVTSASMWWKQRRPEIVEDFDREVYGRAPRKTPKVKWQVVETVRDTVGDFPVIRRSLAGRVDNSSYPQIAVEIQLTLTTPADATGPGDHGVDLRTPSGPAGECAACEALPRPDMACAGAREGLGLCVHRADEHSARQWPGADAGHHRARQQRTTAEARRLGRSAGVGLGASRALDYFETDKAVNAKRVGLEGHSRYGKAVAVAMAYDPRFAVAFISSSGAGGVKLHRRNFGELVENVAAPNEYHWMAGNYLKYAGPLQWKDLPVDSHQLVALCAPRPVFISAGAAEGDGWVDAKGMFLAGVGAGPVYTLLGKKPLPTAEFPPIETALIEGDIGFRQHAGGHTPGPNWPTFLQFAERYFGAAARAE